MPDVSFSRLLASLPDAAAVTDGVGHLLAFNDRFCQATNSPATDLHGRAIAAFLRGPHGTGTAAGVVRHFEDADAPPWVGQLVLGRRGRRGRRCEAHIGRIDHGGYTNLLFVLREIGGAQHVHRGIARSARIDALTGLLNRGAFTREMELAVLRAVQTGERLALVFIDLDEFKQVNDGHGHATGDMVLGEAARRFARIVRKQDLLARWGGDEFACLVTQADEAAIADIAARLSETTSRPLPPPVEGGIGASIGIARLPDDATTTRGLLAAADQALYEAKRQGGRTWCIFGPELASRSSERLRLRRDLDRAMAGDELRLYYQPIVAAETLEPHCLEALVRWCHPSRGVLAPGAFLGLLTGSAERMLRLLQIQIERALADLDAIRPIAGKLAVNVDARLIGRSEAFALLEPLHASLERSRHALCVELTEVAFGEQPAKLQSFIHDIRREGMQLAIDDFGVGRASLLRLSEISFDILKVDRAFIRGIAVSARDRTISALAAKVAGELSGTSVAEGVETTSQVAWARQLGYHALQGFRIARPMPPAALAAWHARWQAVERPRLLAEMAALEGARVRPRPPSDLSDN